MDNDKNTDIDNELTAEEKSAEEEALSEVKDEELKSQVAEKFGINPEEDEDLFNKIVEREKEYKGKLSSAIKQKIKYREQLTSSASQDPKNNSGTGEPQPNNDNVLTTEKLDEILDEREAKRELSRLNLSEEIETEVRDLAKVKGISVREALQLPYISNRIEEAEKEKRISSATPKRKGKGKFVSSYDPSQALDPVDFKLDTEEGQKAWLEAKAARQKFLAEQQ